MKYSLIIPLYNRPDETEELLKSLTLQHYKEPFEVVVVEDGSSVPSEAIVNRYKDQLNLKYFTKPNSGPGLSRNYGADRASGEYLIFLDSDCIIPENYLKEVDDAVDKYGLEVFGGPDKAHHSFTAIQKSINYAMTSFFTTGGIRNKASGMEKFHPRSFNMGIKKQAFEQLGGFANLRFGEDIDFSIRLMKHGFKTGLIPEAYVYHKRRTDYKKFFKQVYNSGLARIVLYKRYPSSLKIVHFLPAVFTIGLSLSFLLGMKFPLFIALTQIFTLVTFFDAALKEKSLIVGLLSILASYVQLIGYGTGFIVSFWRNIVLGQDYEKAFVRKFYD